MQTHLRRRGPPRADDNRCYLCDVLFRSYAGMRQHQRRAHPAEYNRELELRYEGDGNALPPSADEDDIRMANLEAVYEGRSINGFLFAHFQGRDLNFIKNRRRRPRCQDFLRQLQGNKQPQPNGEQELQPELREEAAALPQRVEVELVLKELIPVSPTDQHDRLRISESAGRGVRTAE